MKTKEILAKNSNPGNKSTTWCPYPFNYAMLTPDLEVRPCCRYLPPNKSENPKLTTIKDLGNILRGPYFKEIQSKMLSNNKLPGCSNCYIEEQNNIPSLRQKTIEENNLKINNNVKLLSLEIGVGRLCNLKCRTCSSQYSTKWDHDERLLNLNNSSTNIDEVDLENFPEFLFSEIKELKISGGEPFLSKSFFKFLEKFTSSGFSSNCDIEIFTNSTIFPNSNVTQSLTSFKSTKISLSIDGIGAKNNYIRNPSIWENVISNLELWKQWNANEASHTLWIAHTVSIFNISDIFEFMDWTNNFFGNKTSLILQIVNGPKYLSVYNAPLKIKQKIHTHLKNQIDNKFSNLNIKKNKKNISKIFNLLTPTNKEESDFSLFIKKTTDLDKIRNENFYNIFPNLKKWISEAYG